MNESDTSQQLGRTSDTKRDGKWEAAFLAQLTHELADKVAAFAKRRAQYIERKTGTRDPNLASELYEDALGDTWAGTVTWEPRKASLELHLKRVIKSRTSHELQRIERFPTVAADRPSIGLEREMSCALAVERSRVDPEQTKTRVDDLMEGLALLATGDDEVLQLLDCYDRQILDRRDVMRVTDMTATTYHNARRRVMRLVEKLPQDVRDAAIESMA
jgi:hypothetical protein